jgi:hypothetical protein
MWSTTRNAVSKIALLLSVFSIGLGFQSKCGYHAPPEYKRIFDLPRDQQKEEFRRLPLDKQVDMFRYAIFREPPSIQYVNFLANDGREVIPLLLQRLREEKSDYAKAMLIRVFREMHEKYYSLHNENEVIDVLKRESGTINDSAWREESEKYIKTILERPGVSNM